MTIVSFSDRTKLPEQDVCIIGAGPIGIALALACEARGLSVLLLESGGLLPDPSSNSLSKAKIDDPSTHAAMDVAVCRALGGTSHWWGGRCVAFDDIDFAPRCGLAGAEWPFEHAEIKEWYDSSAKFLACGSSEFSRPPSKTRLSQTVTFDSVERWVPQAKLGTVYKERLRRSEKIYVVLDATVTRLQFSHEENRIRAITIADKAGALSIDVGTCALAGGGLETTRLLLVAQRERPDRFGGPSGALGRYYMGHISGKLADVLFDDPADVADFDFQLDDGVFLRRHFALQEAVLDQEKILNIAFWIDNPPFYDAEHGNGALSLVWLALAVPFVGRRLLPEAVRLMHVGPPPHRFRTHMANILGAPAGTIGSIARIVRDRYLRKPRRPGFLIHSRAGRYGLHYHAQQVAKPSSRVALLDETDQLGMPRLRIEFAFCDEDANSVIRAHEVLDKGLREARVGQLKYRAGASERFDLVMQQASDGLHQIGTTRMGVSPGTSVVDPDCRVHGIDNLYVASSSVFPTSGQANPTFVGVAMAFRLAGFLSSRHLANAGHSREYDQ